MPITTNTSTQQNTGDPKKPVKRITISKPVVGKITARKGLRNDIDDLINKLDKK